MTALKDLLESLAKQTIKPDEVIIIDASNDNATMIMVEEISGALPYLVIYQKASPNACRQRNTGYELSHGEYLFFLDDDVVLDPELIEVIIDTFKELRGLPVGGMTGRILNVNVEQISNKGMEGLFKKLFFLSDIGNGKIKASGFPSVKTDGSPAFVEFVSGCLMVFPRSVFSQFLFDENLGKLSGYSYMEDVDLSFRVGKQYLLYYQPRARLKHFPSTYRTYNTRNLRRTMIQNHRYLFKKNHKRDFYHVISHWLSITGAFLFNAIIERNMDACLGIIDGLKNPLESI